MYVWVSWYRTDITLAKVTDAGWRLFATFRLRIAECEREVTNSMLMCFNLSEGPRKLSKLHRVFPYIWRSQADEDTSASIVCDQVNEKVVLMISKMPLFFKLVTLINIITCHASVYKHASDVRTTRTVNRWYKQWAEHVKCVRQVLERSTNGDFGNYITQVQHRA